MNPHDPIPGDTLPTPLVRAVAVFEADADGDRPFRAVHRLIDAIEVLCKLYTVAGLARFVEALGEQMGGDRLYLGQSDQLRTSAPRGRHRAWLEEVQFARMEARPRDGMLRPITVLWVPLGDRPVARPKPLKQVVVSWLEEARTPALDKLWTLSLDGQ